LALTLLKFSLRAATSPGWSVPVHFCFLFFLHLLSFLSSVSVFSQLSNVVDAKTSGPLAGGLITKVLYERGLKIGIMGLAERSLSLLAAFARLLPAVFFLFLILPLFLIFSLLFFVVISSLQ
jgi:hypothetical protein